VIGYIINKITGIPYYVYIFGAEFRQHKWLNWLKRRILNNARAIMPIADFIKSEAINAGVRNKNFIKINPGVNLDIFHPGMDCEIVISQYGLKGKKIILTVARFDRNKGVDIAIKSLPSVLEKVPNAVYLVLGSGPCEQEWRRLVKTMGLEEKVIFGGFIPNEELPVYYNACDVFLLATRALKEFGYVEGFGIVFIEANACGKPVVGGDVGGVSEAIIDAVTGILVNPLSTEEISEALVKLLADGELARKMGQAGRRRAEEEFSWKTKVAPLLKALG
jgi:phosphatidylinositol alpha-1,6-mannosyltransferase